MCVCYELCLLGQICELVTLSLLLVLGWKYTFIPQTSSNRTCKFVYLHVVCVYMYVYFGQGWSLSVCGQVSLNTLHICCWLGQRSWTIDSHSTSILIWEGGGLWLSMSLSPTKTNQVCQLGHSTTNREPMRFRSVANKGCSSQLYREDRTTLFTAGCSTIL